MLVVSLSALSFAAENFSPSHTFHPWSCVPISSVPSPRGNSAVTTLLESPLAVVKFAILPSCNRDSPASVATHKVAVRVARHRAHQVAAQPVCLRIGLHALPGRRA